MESKCKQFRNLIDQFFKLHKSGTQFNGSYLVNYCRTKSKQYFAYPDTILRQMRTLKDDGVINYRCIDKKVSLYEKL